MSNKCSPWEPPSSGKCRWWAVLSGDMSDALRTDMEGALDLKVLVYLHLSTGETLLTRLVHWPEEGDWITVWDPQHLGDRDSTRKVYRDQVSSWSVSDVGYS